MQSRPTREMVRKPPFFIKGKTFQVTELKCVCVSVLPEDIEGKDQGGEGKASLQCKASNLLANLLSFGLRF